MLGEVGGLETVQAGAWSIDRIVDVRKKENICTLCERPTTYCWHTYWTSPKLCSTEDQCIIDSDPPQRALVVEDDIIPDEKYYPFENYFPNIATYEDSVIIVTPKDLWPCGNNFGHGSGGKYSKYHTITRCGVGVHYVNTYKMCMYNLSMPLP